MGASERVPVGRGDVQVGGEGRTPGGVAVGARERVPVGRGDVHDGGGGGHLELLQWARQNGCEWDEDTCKLAAKGGHLEVLQWAHENGCPWDENTCEYAAYGGHLEVLQWARENGCPWDEKTSAGAAEGGHLEVLQWADENECPWNEDTCEYAAFGGHCWGGAAVGSAGEATVLQWARGTSTRARRAAYGGHLEVLQWARRNGCPWNKNTCTPRRREGTWRCCSGRVRTGARGTRTRASTRRGRAPGDAAVGASERVPVGREDVLGRQCSTTWRCCSGRVRTGARGRSRRRGRREAKSRCRPYLIEHGCPGAA